LGTLVWLLAGLCNVQAAEVVYTLSGIGNGQLGINSFFSAPFTVTSTSDTSLITQPSSGIFYLPDITATVFVSGIGTAKFTIPTINVVNQGIPAVGISDPGQGLAILFANNSAFTRRHHLHSRYRKQQNLRADRNGMMATFITETNEPISEGCGIREQKAKLLPLQHFITEAGVARPVSAR